jgi:glucose-1-phosphate cytidylyltransferase
MDVIILCAGQGARMREETEYRPKPMVEVGGRPLLWHIMRLFGHHGNPVRHGDCLTVGQASRLP